MNESKTISPPQEKKIVGSTQTKNEQKPKALVILRGITTSKVNPALKAKNPYPARVFLKKDCAICLSEKKRCWHIVNTNADIPVFFRMKETPTYGGFIKENTGKYVNYSKCYNTERGNKCLYDDTEHCGECLDKLKQEFKNCEKWIKPKIKTGSYLEVKGFFDNPKTGSFRQSFTAYSYQILNQEQAKVEYLKK